MKPLSTDSNNDPRVKNIPSIQNQISYHSFKEKTNLGDTFLISLDVISQGGIMNDGTIGLDPTTLVIDGALTGTGLVQISQGSVLELNGSVSAGQTIQFVSDDAEIILGDSSKFSGTITSFSLGDFFDISNLQYSNDTIALNQQTISILDSQDSVLVSVNFETGLPLYDLLISSDGNGGTEISTIPCFMKNTNISGINAKIPVQNLKVGDKILGLDNTEYAIKWIGYRTYRQPFKAKDRAIFPICVSSSALSDNIPSTDLFLSPDHSLLIEGVLVPVKYLVNGRSIRIIDDLDEISYFHIELENHNIILAEDTPVETYINSKNRDIFENFGNYNENLSSTIDVDMVLCRPKLQSFRDAAAIRQLLARRAGCKKLTRKQTKSLHFDGFLDRATRQEIVGWAWSPEHPERHIQLEVFVNNGLIAKITADRFRNDLLQAKIGNGCYGFHLTFLPDLSNSNHLIDVRFAANGRSLARCPAILPLSDVFKSANSSTLSRRSNKHKNALFIDSAWPDERRDAGSNAILDHMKAMLKLGYEVDFIASEDCPLKSEECLQKNNISPITKRQFATVEGLLQSQHSKYSVVYLHRLDTAKRYSGLVQSLCHDKTSKPSLKIYNMADLQYLRAIREAQCKNDSRIEKLGKSLWLDELLIVRQFDKVITHSPIEAQILRRQFPGIQPYVVPWSFQPKKSKLNFKDRGGIGFIGSSQHSPNQDAVSWLIFEIMPALWSIKPEITLKIIGSGWSQSMFPKLDRRIEIVGQVDDLNAIAETLRLTVAPLRFGAGIKAKVLESFASDLPCVLTPCAAEGILLHPTYNRLVNDTSAGIAELLVDLHSDQEKNSRYAKMGQEMISTYYSEEAVLTAMSDVLTKIPSLGDCIVSAA